MSYPKRNWRVVAIDPGNAPTICAIADGGETAKWYDPEHTGGYRVRAGRDGGKDPTQRVDRSRVQKILEYHDPDLVVIEKIWVRPKQGVVSSARLVLCMGLCEGVAVGMGLSVMAVFPQTWMKFHGIITKDKAYHRTYASLLAPQWSWAFTRSKDHNRADAFLMAMCGLAYLQKSYEAAVRKGAPLDHTPRIDVIR